MATTIGAELIDMGLVQVHPTGFVDPTNTTCHTKVLCGEMMRGVGGILLTTSGERFVNELAPRDKVVAAERASGSSEFIIVLSSAMAVEAGRHVDLYLKKGLLVKVEGVVGLSKWMSLGTEDEQRASAAKLNAAGLESTLTRVLHAYNAAAASGSDTFGKTSFRSTPIDINDTFYVGRIVPVLHYTMGGVVIDANGRVLRRDGSFIMGLSAAGEVTGGVHGNNRLGGNSLLECTVFGGIVGDRLGKQIQDGMRWKQSTLTTPPAGAVHTAGVAAAPSPAVSDEEVGGSSRTVTVEELKKHTTDDDAWVALYGKVYDFSNFLEEHPAGPESILNLAGTDGTDTFETVHNQGMLEEFENNVVGILAD